MELLVDPRSWLSFLTLAVLEVVLGIDNIIFLALLVDRLPPAQRRSARYLGSGFAMLTRLRAAARVDCEGLRLAREEVFVAFRLMPAALFLERRRVFSATALAWNARLY